MSLILASAAAIACTLAVFYTADRPPADTAPRDMLAMAVLGDSNSHSYHDSLLSPARPGQWRGEYHKRSLQWTEVLFRLRNSQINQGPWVEWGKSGIIALLRHSVMLPVGKVPRKEDFLYNFAVSGATCSNLVGGWSERQQQSARLARLMDTDPERWRNAVVVIRMGFNDWASLLDIQAQNPDDPRLEQTIGFCLDRIRRSIALIHSRHPQTRFLVVGILNEADDPAMFSKYQSAQATANIKKALERFNTRLKQMADTMPLTAFFDDAAWFRGLWGERGADGSPAYRTVQAGDLSVTNTAGDELHNAILADSHAGLVFNLLWAQALIACLNQSFGLKLTPVTDEEITRFINER